MSDFYNHLLKTVFADADLTPATLKKSPGLKHLVKINDRGAKQTDRPFEIRGSRTSGSDYGAVKTDSGVIGARGDGERWSVRRGRIVHLVHVNVEDAMLSKNTSRDAWAQARAQEVEAGLGELGQLVERQIFGTEGGAIGFARYDDQVFGTSPTFSLTFEGANKPAIKGLAVGDHIVISATDGTNGAGSLVGSVGVVVEVSYSLGYARVGTTASPTTAANPGSWTDNTSFFVFRKGFFNANGVTANQVTPLAAYVPLTWSGSTPALNGVTRNVNELTAGFRLLAADLIGLNYRERIEELAANMSEQGLGGSGYVCIMSPKDWTVMARQEKELSANAPISGSADFGFTSITIQTALGPVKCISHPNKQRGDGLLIPQDDNGPELDCAEGKIAAIPGEWSAVADTASTAAAPRLETLIMSICSLTIGNPAAYGRVSFA
jgi:hypothetical protein